MDSPRAAGTRSGAGSMASSRTGVPPLNLDDADDDQIDYERFLAPAHDFDDNVSGIMGTLTM